MADGELSAPGGTPPAEPPPTGPPCRHLRSKGMYVYTDGSGSDGHDDYDNSIYWCLQTMKSFGPDDDMVNREDCCLTGRPCYEPL
jgi:hypothetical protein